MWNFKTGAGSRQRVTMPAAAAAAAAAAASIQRGRGLQAGIVLLIHEEQNASQAAPKATPALRPCL